MKQKVNYETGPIGNLYFDPSDNSRVSYNDFKSIPLPSIFGSDNGEPETSLEIDGKYYILNGDFRKQYEDAFLKFGNDVEKIKAAVYDKYKDKYNSSWTSK